ncbi:PucR C-terminal helix-turn-helix domain-containing protein [Amycolatopsis marina]|uniref:PucR C-terminal helix-turn-helix domain-containing protein n=1 Tax=Amycolatopsis marina TaxID=490629 RepID=A0A1I1BHQ8_9PSEU|nr:helix-turn-helix domain-containing protein [Amycolatopsis marina]SFB49904.1 PucR C-terminal helix-turn-helix domain-containing protein [Amycolatopsis marina]
MTVTVERPVSTTGGRPIASHELAEWFRPHTELLAKAVIYEIQYAIPEYTRPLDGAFGACVRQGVEQAVRYAASRAGGHDGLPEQCADMFRELGKIELRQGRSLDRLQAAYRIGGRVAWRHLAEFGQSHGVPPGIMCAWADAIFAFVGSMSAYSIEGYRAARASAAESLSRCRRRLLEQILADPPASPHRLRELATAARWPLPDWVTVVALEPGTELPEIPAREGMLAALDGPQPCLVLAVPDGSTGRVENEFPGGRAAVSPKVRLCDAASSLRWARRTMTLLRHGAIPSAPVVHCVDHLSTLFLLTDRFLLTQIGNRSLAPLAGLTAKRRARLGETLLAWLQSRSSAPELADQLGVHPQTVRYRMRQLEGLFGDRLDDPNERLNLEVTLRAEQLAAIGAVFD